MFLALKLAMAHVPGMQIRCEPRKRGKKPSWKNGLGIELVRDVAALRKSKKVTYQQAIAELRMNKEKPWGGLYGSQPHHSPSRSTQGGTTLSAFVRTTERVAIVATRKGQRTDGTDRRKFKSSKLVGDENRPRRFCVGSALLLSRCPYH